MRERASIRWPASVPSGSALLEALLALLVFSIGILALAGLEANALKQVSQGKYRTDASLLANQLAGEMWIGDRSSAALINNFSSNPPGPAYATWRAQVMRALPGASAYPPVVAIVDIPGARQATITVRWKIPGEDSADPAHSYLLIAQIN